MSLRGRWTELLSDIRDQGRYRVLSLPSGIDLCSNDYLGYSSAPRQTDSSPAQERELTQLRSATAARLLRGHHVIWEQVETTLASWHGAEACLMMNSGYAANEGLLSTVIQPSDWVASDQSNHASIIDGLRLSRAERFVYRHGDLNHLADGLRRAALQRDASRELFIVTESLFGMEGDIAPLAAIASLADQFGAHLIVDEAHATGCLGDRGSGLVDRLGLRTRVLASMHTGGKALAVVGAYICTSKLLRELLINRCRHFMFSTALPPAVGLWWRDAIARVQSDEVSRESLRRAVIAFRQALAQSGIAAGGTEYVVPVIVGGDHRCTRAAELLRAEGFDIRAIRYPTVPEGEARLRISIHANHSVATLNAVAEALTRVLESCR